MSRVVFVLTVALALVDAPAFAASIQTAAPVPPPPPAAPARDTRTATPETARILGRVTSAEGRPLRRAQLRATAPELREPRTVSTDTDGNFELDTLPAGRYTLRVTRSGYVGLTYGQRYPGELNVPVRVTSGETVEHINFVLPRAGVIAGRVLDEVGDPIAGVNMYSMQLRYFQGRRRLVPVDTQSRTDDTGQFRLVGLTPGEYYVMATTRESWVVGGKERTVMAFAPTYYPGSASVATAQRVRVGLGQEVSGIDFALVAGRAASISGVALSSNGAPLVSASVSLTQEIRGPTSSTMMSVGSTRTAADGSFKLTNVSPGEYKISSRAADAGSADAATQIIFVDGADIEGVTLTVSAGGTIAGQVMVEGDAGFPFPLSRLRLMLRSVDGVVNSSNPVGSKNGAVGEDGQFELTGVIGTQRLALLSVPDGWILKTIDREGTELADLDLSMRSGERWDGVKVVLSNRLTTVTGAVAAERDDQAGTGTVLLYRDDPALWGDGSRHVRAVRPSQAGEFEVKGLLPGAYYGIAVGYLAEGDWFDPEVLASLRDRSTRFTLSEGESRTLKLKLTPPVP